MADPFSIFPDKVWEKILSKLDNSEDILNAFKAYPQLEAEGVLKSTRHLWLFDQVLPHISSYLSQNELLFCGEVCPQWAHGTNKFLENHPTRRPFLQEIQIPQQHEIPETPEANYHASRAIPEGNTFMSLEMFDEFIIHHSTNTNPFPDRVVSISDEMMFNPIQQSLFWNRALEFLRSFGKHIWFLRINYMVVSDQIQFFKVVRNILGLVPDLKGIRIHSKSKTNFNLSKFQSFLELNQPFFPSLPQLETLEVESDGLSSALVYILLFFYSKQLRRLSIGHRFWRQEYCHLLPKLVELTVDGITTKNGASDLLFSLDTPELSKLELLITSKDPLLVIDIGNDLVPWLQRFPQIQSLLIKSPNFSFSNDGSSSPITCSAPSLKHLSIASGVEMDIEFLRCFPTLENVVIYYDTVVDRGLFGMEDRYDLSIWEELPKLREMRLSHWLPPVVYATREGYINWKMDAIKVKDNV